WLAGAALAALALVFVLRPLLGQRGAQGVSRGKANIAVYKDQLRELDADLAAGTLSRVDYERSRLELEARLLEDVPAAEATGKAGAVCGVAIAVGIAGPVLAPVVYLRA